MGIKAKILIPTIVLTLLVALGILVSNIILFSGFVDETMIDRVNSASKVAEHHLQDLKEKAASAALGMAENRELRRALTRNDREALFIQAAQMQDKAEVDFCTITDPEGRVILRTHEPEQYGDLVTSQAAVQAAMAGKSLTAVERGTVIRLSVRSSMPILDEQGATAGIVLVGYRLDTEHFVDVMKEISGCESTVYLDDERISTTVLQKDGGRAIGTTVSDRLSSTVLAGNTYAGRIDILGRAAVVRCTPVSGPDGRAVGMLLAGRYIDDAEQIILWFVQSGAVIALVMSALVIGGILLIVKRIVTPIQAMTMAASSLASGDIDIDIRVDTKDEMHTLADAFSRMIESTRLQVRAVEQIAGGDLTVSLQTRSEKDLMNRALAKLSETLRAQADDIRNAHNRIGLLTNATPLAFNLWDRDLRNIETNDTAVRLFGLASQREYLERFFDLSPEYQPDGRLSKEKAPALVQETFEKGYLLFDWLHQKPDGTPIPSEVTLVRLAYGDDYVVAGYIRDLREYKKMLAAIDQRDALLQTANRVAENLLRAEPDDFSDILHQSMGMMARAIDADRMYLFKNHTENGTLLFTQLREWSEDVRSFQDTDLTTNRAYHEQLPEIRKILLRGKCVHSLVRNLPAVERKHFVDQGMLVVLIIPIFMHNEFWGFVGFDNCRSERLFTENEESIMRSGSLLIVNALLRNEYLHSIRDTSAKLESALADAKEANKTKSNFLAHMSHEIRTPLNAVIGLSELTLGEESLTPETESNLEKICGAGSTILSIVNDILDISKIESGRFELNPVRYDTPSLINDTVTLNIVLIQEKPIRFELHVDENLPGELYGDDLRLKQVFNNLLSNAFKYTTSGVVEWRVSFERDGDAVWLISSVRDTGIGIKPEDTQKLFSEYNQVDMRTNRRAGGSGLGLAITKRLVEMMGGNITVESEYGRGTTFHLRLRQALFSSTPIGKEVAGNLMDLRYTFARRTRYTKLARVNLSYAHVLVVDDIETNLDVVKGMLKPYAVKVDCAISGRQAVEMIRAEHPRYSAVFMDHMMPGMDGVEATQLIRQEIGTEYARNIPIIALTANAVVGNEEMFLRKGFQAFISKPIDVMKLDSILRRWVRNKDLEKELSGTDGGADSPGFEPQGGGSETSLLGGITINGVDILGALERFGGNERVFIDVLRSYAVNVRLLLHSLPEYLAAENFTDYGIVIHGIKGSSYGIAAKRIGKEAELLEHAVKVGNVTAVRAGHPSFMAAAETLIADIDAALGEIDAAASKPGAAEPSSALLREVREACAAFDMDRVDKAMAQLEAFQYERGGKIVVWLREQINTMSFEKIFKGQWPTEE